MAATPKRALVTGITGQDGSYLAEFLLERGYEVHGLVRRTSVLTRSRIEHLHHPADGRPGALKLHYGDITDLPSVVRIVEESQPDEVYNLAAQSHVRISFDMPDYTFEVTGRGAFNVLEAVKQAAPEARVYQAGSSEMFGLAEDSPQNEDTPFHPRSPYGVAKVFAHQTAVLFREADGLFVANGILFNHESPRRGANFVTRKIAIAASRIEAGLEKTLTLGNLDARRDWGYAPEYVQLMWRMLQQDDPDDYVVATGETHSVQDFLEASFLRVGLNWHDHVGLDEQFERPAEVPALCGDASKAAVKLGWTPGVRFDELVTIMVDAERAAAAAESRQAER
jgi:GDPmannose 4,6-dehydratase